MRAEAGDRLPAALRLSMFLDRLRELLDERDLSQADLARGLGVGVATVSEWFTRGRVPQGDTLLQLPGFLNVNGHWLLTGQGPRDIAAGEGNAYQDGALEVLNEVKATVQKLETRFAVTA